MIGELEKIRALIQVYEQTQRLSAAIENFRSRAATALARAAAAEGEAHILDAEMVLLKLEIETPSDLFAWRRETKAAAARKRLTEAEGETARLAERVSAARAEAELCLEEIPAGEHSLAEARAQLIGVPDLGDLRACEKAISQADQGQPAAS